MAAKAKKRTAPKTKVLFVASEAHPLMKTGGLGDVVGSLPGALMSIGCDVRLLMPAYADALARCPDAKPVAQIELPHLWQTVRLLEGTLPGTRVKTWLVDFPPAFDRPGNPYVNAYGHPWHDNAARFALLGRVAALVALGRAELRWRPDIVHCHDWQTGLVPVFLSGESARPPSVFTIHNLAYQGLFPFETFASLGLPETLWSFEALEFHGELSYIKGGLVFADWLTTVSPTYAKEIQTPEFGFGLEGLLQHRGKHLVGILNGIDERTWDPAKDAYLAQPYSRTRLSGKRTNKRALQEEFGLKPDPERPLLGLVGRLVEQKGIDLILDALPSLATRSVQLAILGSGDATYEEALKHAAKDHDWLSVRIAYDEGVAHRIEAGADLFLMPSRFEPCGLNQLYSLRYGTPPIARRIGGLADTVVDATTETLADGTATGFLFDEASPDALVATIDRALLLYKNKAAWKKLATTGMKGNFSWEHSASEYLALYQRAMKEKAKA